VRKNVKKIVNFSLLERVKGTGQLADQSLSSGIGAVLTTERSIEASHPSHRKIVTIGRMSHTRLELSGMDNF